MISATFYYWRSKFVGMDASMTKRFKELEEKNKRLKRCMRKSVLKRISVMSSLSESFTEIKTT
jgi:putative transposase